MNRLPLSAVCSTCGHTLNFHEIQAPGGRGCRTCMCEEFTLKSAPDDRQVGGDHYQRAIQVWEIVQVWDLGFFRGNALKYLLRAGNKGPAVEDLKKCRHYLDKLIEMEEEK